MGACTALLATSCIIASIKTIVHDNKLLGHDVCSLIKSQAWSDCHCKVTTSYDLGYYNNTIILYILHYVPNIYPDQ